MSIEELISPYTGRHSALLAQRDIAAEIQAEFEAEAEVVTAPRHRATDLDIVEGHDSSYYVPRHRALSAA